MQAPRVTVLSYGSGNVRSAVRALERVGAQVTLTSDPHEVAEADGLVVPGVGAFGAVMEQLRAAGRYWESAWACRSCSSAPRSMGPLRMGWDNGPVPCPA